MTPNIFYVNFIIQCNYVKVKKKKDYKQLKKKILLILALVIAVGGLSFSALNISTMDYGIVAAADKECTSILPHAWCDGKEGDSVFKILNLVLYVITAGVGVLGMAGIVIAGIQYATAADNEAQVAAAKERIRNIVIGLVLWATMFALVQWLTIGRT